MEVDQISTQMSSDSVMLAITAIGKVTARPTGMEEGVARVGCTRKLTNASTRLAPGQNKVTKAERERKKNGRKDLTVGLAWGLLI